MSAEFREKLKKLVSDYIDTANMDYILDLAMVLTTVVDHDVNSIFNLKKN